MNVLLTPNGLLRRNSFSKSQSRELCVNRNKKNQEFVLYSSVDSAKLGKSWFYAFKISKSSKAINDFLVATKKENTVINGLVLTKPVDANFNKPSFKRIRRVNRFTRHFKNQRKPNNRILGFLLSVITTTSILFAAILFIPAAYYMVFPADVIEVVPEEKGSMLGGDFDIDTSAVDTNMDPEPYIPARDETLPEGEWLIIPRIGVRTPLRKTENPDEALRLGVWHVPEFGDPGDRSQPMILAAHRFGWQWWWKDEYWRFNSFYKLPETQPGDLIEIISDKRKWIYEIYAGEEGDEITDYSGDLILYTCKYLQSPIRHFRYARIINPTIMTQ